MVSTGTLARTPTAHTTRGSIVSPVPRPPAPPTTAVGSAAARRTSVVADEGMAAARVRGLGAGDPLERRLTLGEPAHVLEREPHLGPEGVQGAGRDVGGQHDVVE